MIRNINQYIMKGANMFNSTPNKYIPSPQAATLILNYFVYNNFQDFNTWQQIAKTRVQYDYIQNQKSFFQCKVVLKWDQRIFPTLFESGQAKSKRLAKKRALKKLIETIINQGYIGIGFKQENFVQKLPRRRKNDSDQSQQEIQQEKYPERAMFLSLLKVKKYQQIFLKLSDHQTKWKHHQIIQCWRHGLTIKSVDFLSKVIKAYRLQPVYFEQAIETDRFDISEQKRILPRQLSYGKQVNNPLQEELTDFIRYQQLQKNFISTHKHIRQPIIDIHPIPSQNVLKQMEAMINPSRQILTYYFHPIEGRKIFLSSSLGSKHLYDEVNVDIPKFQSEEREISLELMEEMYALLPYYCLDYNFIEEVIKMMRQEIKGIQIKFDQSIEYKYQQKGMDYYLNFKNLLTAQFSYLLHSKLISSDQNVSIEGMITPSKPQDNVFVFNYKQPQEIMNRKINRRANFNEFDEMRQISMNQFVALVSKLDRRVVYIGQIVELTPSIRIYLPSYKDQVVDPQPFTVVKIYNSKIFTKTSSSIIKAAKYCMKVIHEKTTLIWQPPSFPTFSVLSQLLIQWQIIKATVLIISVDAQNLQTELTNLGFKVVRITSKTEQRLLVKYNIVIALPSVVCSEIIKNYAFSRVIIQSCHQISQVSSLSAIVKGCQQLYLMGDPFMPRMQVSSPYCIQKGMGMSLMERLYEQGYKTQTYISRIENSGQFRNVMQWADNYIYNKKLRLLGNEMQTPIIKGFPWPSTDYRLCFLHHPMKISDQAEYLDQQAYICSVICGQVIKSGYTKIQQISCSVPKGKMIPFLQKRMSVLLKMLNCTQIKLFTKHMNNLCRVVSGSIYLRTDLSILMLGYEKQNLSFRQLVGAMRQGRRGVIIVGDISIFYGNKDYANLIDWCKEKKLINIVDVNLMAKLQ